MLIVILSVLVNVHCGRCRPNPWPVLLKRKYVFCPHNTLLKLFDHCTLAFAPLLLERKANRIKKDMGIAKDDFHRVRTPYQTAERQSVLLSV